jgi:hypothetical protein
MIGAIAKSFREFGGGVVWDTDAIAAIYAIENDANPTILTISQKRAINNFFIYLKDNALYNYMYALYLFIGGNIFAHKYNYKDPRDLNVAYRLSWNGSAAHNSYGIDWPSSNTINANTWFNPTSNPYNIGMTAYVGRNLITNTIMGAFGGSSMYIRCAGSRSAVGYLYGQSPGTTIPNPSLDYYNTYGVVSLNRTANNYLSLYRAGTKKGSLTYTETGNCNANIYLNNITSNQSGWGGNGRMQFAAIHQGLTDEQVVLFTNGINQLQSDLGRNFSTNTYNLIGDSITRDQAATYHSTSWAGLLCQAKEVREYNYGVSGYTTANVIATTLGLIPNKTSSDTCIIVSIGINDVPGVSISTFEANLITILNALITKGYDNSNIILPTIYWTPSKNTSTGAYNTAITNLWTSYSLSIHADVWQAIIDSGIGASGFHADGIHPLDAIHDIIADYYISIL